MLSRVQLFVTPWTVAHQALLSMEFPRQEYWSGLSFPSPGDLPDSGIEPGSPALAGRFFTTEPPGKPTGLLGSHSACHTGPQHSPSLPVATWPGPEPLGSRSRGLGNLARRSRMAQPGLWVWRNYCWPGEAHPPLLGPWSVPSC